MLPLYQVQGYYSSKSNFMPNSMSFPFLVKVGKSENDEGS